MKNIKDLLFKNNKLNKSSDLYLNFKNDFTYHSSKIEGSTITSSENMEIITKQIKQEELAKIHELKYVKENVHLIEVFDYVMETFEKPISEKYIKDLHKQLCYDSPDLIKRDEITGEYRTKDVRVGNHVGARPFVIEKMMKDLIKLEFDNMDLNDIAKFHCEFETIHPFYDGNGRVGRMIMLKQCLKYNVGLFFVNDINKRQYYDSLIYYNATNKPDYMTMYCKEQQAIFNDKYKELISH
jgi:Fic family protein